MELSQRGHSIENIYQDPLRAPESPYQSLQLKHLEGNIQKSSLGQCSTWKGLRILVITWGSINTLLLVIILVMVGVHFAQDNTRLGSHNQAYHLDNQNGFWHLYDNIFYLFWHGHGDCKTAERFCSEKNATLADPQLHNRDWMITVAHRKQFWVKADIYEDSFSGQDEEDCSCELLLATDSPAECEDVHGWVCVRAR